MGAGTYYTLHEDDTDNNPIKACWIDLDFIESEDQYADEFINELNVQSFKKYFAHTILKLFPKMVHDNGDDTFDYGQHYTIKLEPKYYDDGYVINFYMDADDDMWGIVNYNYERCYNKIIKGLSQHFEMRIATSGYTSTVYNP